MGCGSGSVMRIARQGVAVVTFACPRCSATSAHPTDAAEGYCGACHDWTGTDGRCGMPRSRPGMPLINLGSDVWYNRAEFEGEWVGVDYHHRHAVTGRWCSGWIPLTRAVRVATGGPTWEVEQLEPLTLSPSLLCTGCGHHGFIRNGRWESC
jgi:hypothetical protein